MKQVLSISCGCPLAALVLLLSIAPQVLAGSRLEFQSFPLMGGFVISFGVDRLSLGCGLLVSALYLLVMLYSVGYITAQRLSYALLLTLNFGSLLGLIFSQDVLGFYIFFETISISAYFLIIHSREQAALDAGYTYIVMMLLGGLFILIATMVLALAPTEGYAGNLAGICFGLGCLLKAGAFPFHTWLPLAHPAAPSPISALLSGIMIKVGAYGLIRAFFGSDVWGTPSTEIRPFSFELLSKVSQGMSITEGSRLATLVMVTGLLSMVLGVSLALLQQDLKKLLAYHSVSQIGYILLGIGMGTDGLAGGILHLISHAMFKGLLFLAVGAVIFRTGTRTIDTLGGLWRKLPLTTFVCIIAALSISGVPLTSGYASKGMIFVSLRGNLALEIIFIATSAGTCASFLKLVRHSFFGRPHVALPDVNEAPGVMLLPMFVLAAGCVVIGIFPAPVLNVLFGPSAPELHLWTPGHILEALLSLGIGVALYALLLRLGVFGATHTQAAILQQRWPGRTLSVEQGYRALARGFMRLCLALERRHPRSLSHSIQMVISFLVLILGLAFLL